ncbi:MAG: hypothetical protein AAB421_04225 [Patescibacteria group bacterium]
MSGQKIERLDLFKGLGNTSLAQWCTAVGRLGLPVTHASGGTSHYVVRNPKISRDNPQSVITTLYEGMSHQVKGKVFKKFLAHGISEDEIWKALKML